MARFCQFHRNHQLQVSLSMVPTASTARWIYAVPKQDGLFPVYMSHSLHLLVAAEKESPKSPGLSFKIMGGH